MLPTPAKRTSCGAGRRAPPRRRRRASARARVDVLHPDAYIRGRDSPGKPFSPPAAARAASGPWPEPSTISRVGPQRWRTECPAVAAYRLARIRLDDRAQRHAAGAAPWRLKPRDEPPCRARREQIANWSALPADGAQPGAGAAGRRIPVARATPTSAMPGPLSSASNSRPVPSPSAKRADDDLAAAHA